MFIAGGSETFQDKQEHFFKELRDVYRKHTRDKLTLKIARDNIIETVSTHIDILTNLLKLRITVYLPFS